MVWISPSSPGVVLVMNGERSKTPDSGGEGQEGKP